MISMGYRKTWATQNTPHVPSAPHRTQVFGAQEAVDTTQSLLAEGVAPKAVTNRLLNIAVREKRCKDNCSVLLVRFGAAAAEAN
jgi:hypothetical protein